MDVFFLIFFFLAVWSGLIWKPILAGAVTSPSVLSQLPYLSTRSANPFFKMQAIKTEADETHVIYCRSQMLKRMTASVISNVFVSI